MVMVYVVDRGCKVHVFLPKGSVIMFRSRFVSRWADFAQDPVSILELI